MADVKWIKITTDIFDDEKIQLIESLPSADSIIVIWFKLLTLAGKQNNDGVFLMNNRIAYTDEMLAAIFRRDLSILKLALTTFENFGMIEIVDGIVTIPNWNKHQSLDSYGKKKERDRLYQAARREKQRSLIEKSSDNRLTSDDSSSDIAISDKEEDKEREKDINNISPTPSPIRHKYGSYNNVLLSDEDMDKLKDEFPTDYEARIERLSEYIASKGAKYKNHLATIRSWARKEKKSETTSSSFEADEFYEAALKKSYGG